MIDRNSNPTGRSFLIDDLQDAHEHLGNLIKELCSDSEYGEPELRIDLGHVYAHLNRAWRRRNVPHDFSDGEWEAAGAFPTDLEPVA